MKNTMIAALGAAFLLAACSTWFGKADTDEQEAFRALGKYVYVAVPAQKYATLANPDPSLLAALCNVDQSTYDAFQAVRASRLAGGDTFTTVLTGASSALASFSLAVIGNADVSLNAGEIVGKSLIWLRVGTESVGTMRAFRKGYLKPKLDAMRAEGRGPTQAEWDELQFQADGRHAAIQTAAGC